MGVETLLILGGTAAIFGAQKAAADTEEQKTRSEQRGKAEVKINEDRQAELKLESDKRATAKAKAETAGQRAGRSTGRVGFQRSLGFGAAAPAAGLGRGGLFGN